MKPEWSNAPTWANFVAMDDDGSWWWYEEHPIIGEQGEWKRGRGMALLAQDREPSNWELSLRKRP